MKISPVVTTPNTVGSVGGGPAEVRSLTMTTNATPISHPAQLEDLPRPLGSGDNGKQGNGEETRPLSPQFAALARERRALQKERQAFERERADRAAAPQGDTVDLARLRTEPMRVLLEAGVTYDQLTEAILADQHGNSSQLRALEAKVKELETGIDRKLTERETQQERQVLAEMRREATQLAARDEYELVRETRSIPQVMKLIERTYRETGEVLDVSEAMNLVEAELVKESLKLARSKKLQSELAQQYQPQPQQRQMRTLTNRDTASPPMTPKQRAMAAFYGNLQRR